MSGIERLPDHLLGDILILASNVSIEQKYAVAQVSRQWRAVALGSPLHWSSFRLTTRKDLSRLATVLQRSGASTLLDVELNLGSNSSISKLRTLLAPSAPCVRTLNVTVHPNSSYQLDALLDLGFTKLVSLRIQGKGNDERPAVQMERLAAALPALEQLCVVDYGPYLSRDFATVFTRCSRVVRLVLHPTHIIEDFYSPHLDPPRPAISPALRSLSLRLPLRALLKVLDVVLADAILPEIEVLMDATEVKPEDWVRVYGALLRGTAPVVLFDVQSSGRVLLRDAAGRLRSLCVGVPESDIVPALWGFLATRHVQSVCTSVDSIRIRTSCWGDFFLALEAHPLDTADTDLSLRVRILAEWEDVTRHLNRFSAGKLHVMPAIHLPGLGSVELVIEEGFRFPAEVTTHVLRSIKCDHARAVAVSVAGVAPQLSAVELASFQQSIRDKVALDHPSWVLAFALSH